MKKPKILFYDIETSYVEGAVWNLFNTNVAKILKYPELLSFAYQWHGEKTIHCKTRTDYTGNTHKKLCKDLHSLLQEADIVIAHNGVQFDNKKSYAFFVKNKLPPLPKLTSVDTKQGVKSTFGFISNSLDNVCDYLEIGRKMKHPGIDMWTDCMAGKKNAFEKMRKYNKHDIYLLRELYKRIGGWLQNHPNVNLLMGGEKNKGCPKCGSYKIEQRGYRATSAQIKQQLHCLNPECGRWFLGPMPKKSKKKVKNER